MTYELDVEQYVAVAQGSGGTVMLTIGDNLKRKKVNQNKLLVFKLGDFGQTKTLPDERLATILALGHEANSNPDIIKKGEELYGHNCGSCHGIGAKSNYIVPDLRLPLILISEPTRPERISDAVFCLKKKNKNVQILI